MVGGAKMRNAINSQWGQGKQPRFFRNLELMIKVAICAALALGILSCERRQIRESGQTINGSENKEEERRETLLRRNRQADEGAYPNRAVSIEALSSGAKADLGKFQPPGGKSYTTVDTRWENIHPKQQVEKSKLEGKTDRTMGVGDFSRGEAGEKGKYVEVDVAYKIPKLHNHVFLLADGVGHSLHELTAEVEDGIDPASELLIARQGEVKEIRLVFLVPDDAENLALQLLDYAYGHVLVPVQGNAKREAKLGRRGQPDWESTPVRIDIFDGGGTVHTRDGEPRRLI